MSNQSQEIRVGIRIDMQAGISLFGANEVNALIAQGWRVTALQEGGAVLRKLGEEGGNVQMVMSGCDMKVLLDPPAG